MSFGAEVKVWRDRVFEQLNNQITAEEQRHGPDDRLRGGLTAEIFSPDANRFGYDLEEDSGEHEARTERYQILKKTLAKAVRPRLDEHKTADKVCGSGQQAKEKKGD